MFSLQADIECRELLSTERLSQLTSLGSSAAKVLVDPAWIYAVREAQKLKRGQDMITIAAVDPPTRQLCCFVQY